MKRKLFVLAGCILYLLGASAAGEEFSGLKQYQNFSWKAVTNAWKYKIAVQKKNPAGQWTDAETKQTAATHTELLLSSGEYQVKVSAFNVLGKEASSSPWVTFVVLNETEPYLFDSVFDLDQTYHTKVLRLPPSGKSPPFVVSGGISTSATVLLPDTAVKGKLSAGWETPDPINSIKLKGKNIYFSDTQFVLVPAETGPVGSLSFPSYVSARKEVPLVIVRRDRENDTVIVSYDATSIYSGYYNLEVSNPGGKKISLPLLVFSGRPPSFAEDSFEYDRRYKVQTVTVERREGLFFTLQGKNFEYDTKFSLVPSQGISYPFVSSKERHLISLAVNHYSDVDADTGVQKLELSFDYQEIETGYYQLVATTTAMEPVAMQLLVTVTNPAAVKPEIGKIKTKYNKKTQTIIFTATGANLNKIDGGAIVSSFPKGDGEDNRRVPLEITNIDQKGKTLIFSLPAADITPGTYALFLETGDVSIIQYITLNRNFLADLCTLTAGESDELFLRPVELAAPEKIAVPAVPLFAEQALSMLSSDWYFSHTTDNGKFIPGHLVIYPVNMMGSRADSTVNSENVAVLRSGNTIRFKVYDASYPGYWELYLLLKNDKNEECMLKFDLGISRYRQKRNGYYLYDIPYTAFKHVNFTPSVKPFTPSAITVISFRNTGWASYYQQKASIKPTNMYLDVYDAFVYTKAVLKQGEEMTADGRIVKLIDPVVLPYAGFRITGTDPQIKYSEGGGILKNLTYGLDLHLFDWRWYAIDGSAYWNCYTKRWGSDILVRFAIPNKYLQPYAGTGAGITFDGSSKDALYIPMFAGVTLFRLLDLRYTSSLRNPDTFASDSVERRMSNPKYFEDSLSIAVLFRIRQPVRIPVQLQDVNK
jgi:hypothetical protein